MPQEVRRPLDLIARVEELEDGRGIEIGDGYAGTFGVAGILGFITYMSGPNLDQNEPTKLVKGQPEAITASFFLENYGPLGIEVRRTTETPTIFMSWGAVLYIQGPPPEVREQIDKEVSKRTGGEAGST